MWKFFVVAVIKSTDRPVVKKLHNSRLMMLGLEILLQVSDYIEEIRNIISLFRMFSAKELHCSRRVILGLDIECSVLKAEIFESSLLLQELKS
jgi:hypothetical protein